MPGSDEEEKMLGRYRIVRTIGQGSYGKVKLGQNIETGEEVAVKKLLKEELRKRGGNERLKREVRMLKLINHPNVVKLVDVADTVSSIFLIMEHAAGGELFDYIIARKVTERDARRLFRQLLSAITYCHTNFIVHRDLKPENLLLDNQKNLKIIGLIFIYLF